MIRLPGRIHVTRDMAGSTPAPEVGPRTGSFRFWFATQRWEWSPEVYQMHGYVPGVVEPTTQMLLAHKHPEDREHVAEIITRAIDLGEPFSSRHRFLDTYGIEHRVMVVADRILDRDGVTVGTAGFYVELPDTLSHDEQQIIDAQLPGMVQARAAIEQAKAVLMLIYRINADQAFHLLVWRSQETNVKVRALAEQLITELPGAPALPPPTVAAFDHLLLTLHERIPAESPAEL